MQGSAGLRWIIFTQISDGKGGERTVRVGDQVEMLPFEQTNTGKKTQNDYTPEHSYNLEKKELGQGPYTISNIARWPCGRIMLYLKTATSSGMGVYPDNFVAL